MSSGIRMSGMISGIDTESIVQAMVSTQVAKKEKLQKAQTKLEWKQDAYKAINTKVYSLYNKISSLRFTSAYSLKKTTVSDKNKATVTASGNAVTGTQSLKINKLAKAGYLTGANLGEGVKENTTLSQLGYDGDDTTITVRVGSESKDINVTKDTKISELVDQLNKAGVKASFDEKNGRMFVSAKDTGKANDFSLTAKDKNGLGALGAIGLSTASAADTMAYKTSAAYAAKGIDAEGNVVSLFQFDEKGNIKYENGKPVLNGTIADFNDTATKNAIKDILTDLSTAYSENAALTAEKNLLNQKVQYSASKDAVEEFINTHQTDAEGNDTSADVELLMKLLKHGESNYKYVDDEGNIQDSNEGHMAWPSVTDKAKEIAEKLGLITKTTDEYGEVTTDTSGLDTLNGHVKNVLAIEENEAIADKSSYKLEKNAEGKYAYDDGTGTQITVEDRISQIDTEIAANKEFIEANSYWDVKDYTDVDINAKAAEITEKIKTAANILVGTEGYGIVAKEGAVRVDAEDAEIELNGAKFTSDTNNFSINGLNIKATGVTAEGEEITISTDTDTQGIYDKIKDFLAEYNEVMNEICKLYNADAAKGYEPLTDEEKDEMSDSEIEKWEAKVKDALLRKDSTLGDIMNTMSTAMQKSYTINGKSYALSSFGIHTMGYLNAAKNEHYAYHIDGDEDDSVSSGNEDKLMAMIQNNPEDIMDFMKELTSGVYSELDKKMKSTNLRSAYTIYNDKQMTKDLDSYKKQIKTWEDKIQDLEDRYYKQYSNMEKQLAKMQSATSSLTGLLGNGQ